MHIGLGIFATDYAIRVDELAREAEARGFESLWLPEHTHIPVSRDTPYPAGGDLPEEYWHTHDPFVGLTAAAAVTETLKLATGICLLIERDTITTAKSVASLDALSGGRFLFGVGAGWNREEMENHGTDFDSRFKRLREQVLALKEIWTRDEPEFHGDYVDFDPIWSWPKPVQEPHPPVLMGGANKYVRQRVVDYCEGWLPIGFDQDVVLKGLADLERRAQEAGRSRDTIDVTVFGSQPEPEVLSRYAEAGVDRVTLWLPPAGRDKVLPVLDRYGELLSVA